MANHRNYDTTAPHGTSIFRREVSTDPAPAAAESYINRQNSNQSSDTGTAFFVVDMDLTSQGEIMCEEVSHLSDPTSYMLTTPIHTRVPPPPRGRSQRNLSGGASNHGKRRLSASKLLKKPLAAIIRNHYFGYKRQTPRLEHQPSSSSSSKRRKHSNVSPIAEEECKGSPQISQQRVPLTLLVPLGNENSGNYQYTYQSILQQQESDEHVENRDPISSSNKWNSHNTKQRDKPDSTLEMYQNPTLSWDEDNLFLFDDNQTATPRTPLGLGGGAALTFSRNYGTNQMSTSPPKFHNTIGKSNAQSNSKGSWIAAGCCKSNEQGGSSWSPLRLLFQQWGYFVGGLSTASLVIAMVTSVSVGTTGDSSMVDFLYLAVTSFTTLGPVSPMATTNDNGSASPPSMLTMFLTIMYAMMGVTTLGVVWGRHSCVFVQQSLDQQTRQDAIVQRQTLNVFCGPSHRGRNSPIWETARRPSAAQGSPVCKVRSILLGFALVTVTVLLARTLEWNVMETVYHVVTTACTIGDSEMASQPTSTKMFMLLLIPLSLLVTLRWLIAIAAWTIQHSQAPKTRRKDHISMQDLETLMERAELDDGLLTRADFLEMMLLSMKKVDPELVLALREGFQKVTQGGSVDMTRSQLVNSAIQALSDGKI
jgi:hypothetical protein